MPTIVPYALALMIGVVAASDYALARHHADVELLALIAFLVCLAGRTALSLTSSFSRDETLTWQPKKRSDDHLFDPNRKDKT